MIGLKNYFEIDFPRTFKLTHEIFVGGQSSSSPDVEPIIASLHLDLKAHVKFCAYFVPDSTEKSLIDISSGLFSYSSELQAFKYCNKFVVTGGDSCWPTQVIQFKNSTHLVIKISALEEIEYDVRDFVASKIFYLYVDKDVTESDREQIMEIGKFYGFNVVLRDNKYAMKRKEIESPLAFISHDSRDKDQIARHIANGLSRMGCPVWFDEFSLKPGDRLRESIEQGLKECKKCILILTPNFLSNQGWTKTEFNSIFTREILEEQALIIPVWSGIDKKDVYEYSPSLLNILGVIWSDSDQENTLKKLFNVLTV